MMTFCRVKKNLCVAADDENPLQCCFSPGSFLSSAWPVQCPSTLQDSPLAILCLTRHTVHAPARGQQHSSMGMQQGQPWRLPLAIPAVITWQPRANFPIDRVWRVGEKNSLPHGSSNSSEPSFQRLYHEQNGKQDRSLLLPQELSFLKLLSAVVRPC